MNAKQRRKEKRRIKKMGYQVASLVIEIADRAEEGNWSAEQIRHELRHGGLELRSILQEI